MASIKGIELKNVKTFRGHEWEELQQANVYYKGKKVGFYSQDSWGGSDIFRLDSNISNELREEIENITNNYVGNVIFKKIDDLYMKTYNLTFTYDHIGYEYLFEDLLKLVEDEKNYKKYTKMWKTDTITILYRDLFNISIVSGRLKKEDEEKYTYFTYESLNDFIID